MLPSGSAHKLTFFPSRIKHVRNILKTNVCFNVFASLVVWEVLWRKKNVIKLKFGIDLHTTQWAKRTLSLVERSKPNMSQGADLVENNFAQGILKILLRGKGYFKCSNVGFWQPMVAWSKVEATKPKRYRRWPLRSCFDALWWDDKEPRLLTSSWRTTESSDSCGCL